MLKLFRRPSVCFFLEVLGDWSLARKRRSSQLPVDPRGGGSGILAWRRPRSCCAMICVSTPPRCDGHTITHRGSGAPQLTARTGRPRRMCLGRSCTRSLYPSWCSPLLFRARGVRVGHHTRESAEFEIGCSGEAITTPPAQRWSCQEDPH